MSRVRIGLALLLTAGLTAAFPSSPSAGFKPYTHAVVGQYALNDVVDDGRVTIRGRSYPVRTKVVEALRQWPTYYRAGTIGPDGFPDLTYGQSVIHPEKTGEWLRYAMRSAWSAQSNPAYSAAEKGQILAFAYGFLTHASGDVWAHTLVNDFAKGVFPEAKDILTSPAEAAIAIRHIIVEGYIGDATQGFDGNPVRTTLDNGDVSDDSTPGLAMDAPTGWIYNALVDPNRSLPTGACGNDEDDDRDGVADDGCPGSAPYTRGKPEQQRGPLIDYFLDLQSDLQLREQLLQTDRKFTNCWIKDPDCYVRDYDIGVNTVRGRRVGKVRLQVCIGARIGCAASPSDVLEDNTVTLFQENYLDEWVKDIEKGLRVWGRLGLVTTRGLFDAQTRRNLQNRECSEYPDASESRAQCEAGIGITDVVIDQATPFIEDQLLSMLGAPDAAGKVLKALRLLSDFLDKVVGATLNPIRVPLDELRQRARKLILAEVKKVVGIDIETLDHMLKNPSVWMETEQIQMDLGKLGMRTVNLFPPGTRARLDGILGLTEADRRTTDVPMPDGSTRTVGVLRDDAVMRNAAPFDNAVTLSKLLLLDANGLNRVVTDNLVDLGVMNPGITARVYRDGPDVPANVMVDGLNGEGTWLKTIDGDHAWRRDGRPVFTKGAGHGGNGNFPLWESCLARPVFGGALFRDWENGGLFGAFPGLGDAVSSDWADSTGPKGKITIQAPTLLRKGIKVSDIQRFVGVGQLELRATDAIFAESSLRQRLKVVVSTPSGGGIQFRNYSGLGYYPLTDTDGAGDGRFRVALSAGDPCGDLVQQRVLTFTLDTRDPVIAFSAPAEGVVVDSAESFPVAWTVTDPGGSDWASGIDRDQTVGLVGGRFVIDGDRVSAFGLYPGGTSVEVTAVDRVANMGGGSVTFEVQATAASLVINVGQGVTNQAFSDDDVRAQLEEWLRTASSFHDGGDHAAEGQSLMMARDVLQSHRGAGVSEWYADWMTAHIDDLRTRHTG